MTPAEAKQEAAVCIEALKGKQYEFPIWFDLEEKAALNTGKENCSAMVRAFLDELEKAGYFAGLYISRAALADYIGDDIKTRYALWVAEWGSKLNYSGPVGIWQRSDTGTVNGIIGNVDLDISYKDYPAIIKKKGLNGYSSGNPPEKKSEVHAEVTIDGKKYSGTLSAE